MRKRLFKGLAAAVLAVAITGGATTAAPKPAQAAGEIWLDIAVQVATSLFGGSGGGGADLERAKQEIIAAVNASKQEILNHIDAIASADVRACAQSGTLLISQIDAMDEFTLPVFMQNSVNCATLASAYFDAVQSLPAADAIGKLIGEIYSIAMVAFVKIGFTTEELLDSLIRTYEAVVTKLAPTCRAHTTHEPNAPTELWYDCVAYNGDTASDFGRPPLPSQFYRAIENAATRNTSRATAQAALPQLRALQG